MKYNTFEEIYEDNKELIDLEYKKRLYDFLEKLLSQIDKFQENEHKEIDGGMPSSYNDIHRDNIVKLEKIYKPLYNYIKTISVPEFFAHKICTQELKEKFIDIVLPERELNEYRGTRDWPAKYYKHRNKQRALANLLEGFLHEAYMLGASNMYYNPGEIEDHYDTDIIKKYYLNDIGEAIGEEKTFAETRAEHVRHMQSYGKNSILSSMVASIYDSGCRQALKAGKEFSEAVEYGMKNAADFVREIFNPDEN